MVLGCNTFSQTICGANRGLIERSNGLAKAILASSHAGDSQSGLTHGRFLVWSDCNRDGSMTYLILRSPPSMKQKFYACFKDGAATALVRHPMLVHAFLAEQVYTHAYDFLAYFAEPVYEWVRTLAHSVKQVLISR